jgi:hypothetical protein
MRWLEMSKHHEAHEEHEEENIFFKIRCSLRYPIFVSFAPFVVNRPKSIFGHVDQHAIRVGHLKLSEAAFGE